MSPALLFNNPLWRVRRRVIYGLLAGLVAILVFGSRPSQLDWMQAVLPHYMSLLEWVLPSWFTLAVLEDGYNKWLQVGKAVGADK